MQTLGYALFPTAIGHCGIAWGPQGLTGVQLPEPNEAATRARMARRFPDSAETDTVPPDVRKAMAALVALLAGTPQEPADLSDIVLDMDGIPPFYQRVYALARKLPPGETTTYGAMARQLGEPSAARAVGQALGHNPFAPVVPCHRILAAGGAAGGFSSNGGVATKLRMLQIERARIDGPGLFDGL